jgi:hypothetical protein
MPPQDYLLGKAVFSIMKETQSRFSSAVSRISTSNKGIQSRFKAQAQTYQGPDSPSYLRAHSRPVQDNKYKFIIYQITKALDSPNKSEVH